MWNQVEVIFVSCAMAREINYQRVFRLYPRGHVPERVQNLRLATVSISQQNDFDASVIIQLCLLTLEFFSEVLSVSDRILQVVLGVGVRIYANGKDIGNSLTFETVCAID